MSRLCLLFGLCACTPKAPGTDDTAGTAVDRGPTLIPVDGDPNGLWWDGDRLLIADDNNNRVLSWSDADGFGAVGTLAAPAAEGAGLGQLVPADDGTLVVTRFGFGFAGDVATLAPDGAAGVVPGLDPERRRIGLSRAADGTLYVGWFTSTDGGRIGAVSRLDLAGTETTVAEGIGKPVGVLARADGLWVADQDAGALLRFPWGGGSPGLIAEVNGPDLLCEGPDGGVFMGGKDGIVRFIAADGAITAITTAAGEVRGVAYDAGAARVFYVDHDPDDSDGLTNSIGIAPINL